MSFNKVFKFAKIFFLLAMMSYSIALFVANIFYYRNSINYANDNSVSGEHTEKISFLPKISFGIDIVGGHQLTIAINSSEAVGEFVDNSKETILNICKESGTECYITDTNVRSNVKSKIVRDGVKGESKNGEKNNVEHVKRLTMRVRLKNNSNRKDSKTDEKYMKKLIRDIRRTLYQWDIDVMRDNKDDSDGLTSLSMSLSDRTIGKIIADMTDKAILILKNRIDGVGVREILVQRYGMNKIIILIPRDVNIEHVKKVVNTTAKLNFHLMDSHHIFREKPKQIVKDHLLLPSYKSVDGNGTYYIVENKAVLKGDCITDVQPNIDGISNSINFRMNSSGTKKFSDITGKNVGRLLAVVLDEKVLMAPMINVPITNGGASITGHFTSEEVRDLSILLRSGSLPVKISIINERQLGSMFDRNLLSNAFISSICSLLIVTLVMVTCYKVYGLIAIVALVLNFLFTLCVISVFGITLTLPGIAGFILMLGMATDANILIYEKMKDLRRQGVDNDKIVVNSGFARAIGTIFDANITTIIAGIALFGFGDSFIKGFSVTLIFGILCSIFTAINVTRMMIDVFLSMKDRIIYGRSCY